MPMARNPRHQRLSAATPREVPNIPPRATPSFQASSPVCRSLCPVSAPSDSCGMLALHSERRCGIRVPKIPGSANRGAANTRLQYARRGAPFRSERVSALDWNRGAIHQNNRAFLRNTGASSNVGMVTVQPQNRAARFLGGSYRYRICIRHVRRGVKGGLFML